MNLYPRHTVIGWILTRVGMELIVNLIDTWTVARGILPSPINAVGSLLAFITCFCQGTLVLAIQYQVSDESSNQTNNSMIKDYAIP